MEHFMLPNGNSAYLYMDSKGQRDVIKWFKVSSTARVNTQPWMETSHSSWGILEEPPALGFVLALWSCCRKTSAALFLELQGGKFTVTINPRRAWRNIGENSRWVQQTETFPGEKLALGWWGWRKLLWAGLSPGLTGSGIPGHGFPTEFSNRFPTEKGRTWVNVPGGPNFLLGEGAGMSLSLCLAARGRPFPHLLKCEIWVLLSQYDFNLERGVEAVDELNWAALSSSDTEFSQNFRTSWARNGPSMFCPKAEESKAGGGSNR